MSTPPITSNNPFALIQPYGRADKWTGLIGQWPNGFLKFDTPLNGARAGLISFINTYLKRGINTIEKIFPIYAPGGAGSGNDPDAYIRNVELWSGVPRNKPLTDTTDILKVAKAITRVERGRDGLPNNTLVAAWEFAAQYTGITSKVKPLTNKHVILALSTVFIVGLVLWQLTKSN
jgi:hypothetical protein